MKKLIFAIGFLILNFLLLEVVSTKLHSQVPEPCNPDCFETPFPIPGFYAEYDMTPLDCKLKIWYTYRHACNYYYDVQILKIVTEGSQCWAYMPLEKLFKTAYYRLIKENPMGYPPMCEGDKDVFLCNEQWRISQASCWATYDIDCAGHQCTVTVPCIGTDCCLQRMRICRDCPEGIIQVDPLGDPWPSQNCGASSPPPGAPPGTHCNPVCNWFLYSDGGIILPGSEESSKAGNKKGGIEIHSNEFPISITSEKEGKYVIHITDAYGNIYIQQSGKLEVGKNKINIKLQDLKEGNYIYSISVDGVLLESDKIILTK